MLHNAGKGKFCVAHLLRNLLWQKQIISYIFRTCSVLKACLPSDDSFIFTTDLAGLLLTCEKQSDFLGFTTRGRMEPQNYMVAFMAGRWRDLGPWRRLAWVKWVKP